MRHGVRDKWLEGWHPSAKRDLLLAGHVHHADWFLLRQPLAFIECVRTEHWLLLAVDRATWISHRCFCTTGKCARWQAGGAMDE